ncbi:MAG: hypothetical protein JJ854_17285, partial [Pseudomonadales bacterium]|nr:hypothetical protein [Pseudomonadales bacterium]
MQKILILGLAVMFIGLHISGNWHADSGKQHGEAYEVEQVDHVVQPQSENPQELIHPAIITRQETPTIDGTLHPELGNLLNASTAFNQDRLLAGFMWQDTPSLNEAMNPETSRFMWEDSAPAASPTAVEDPALSRSLWEVEQLDVNQMLAGFMWQDTPSLNEAMNPETSRFMWEDSAPAASPTAVEDPLLSRSLWEVEQLDVNQMLAGFMWQDTPSLNEAMNPETSRFMW